MSHNVFAGSQELCGRQEERLRCRITRSVFLRGCMGAAGALALAGKVTAQGTVDRMQTRLIPSSDKLLPIVGCGTWRTFHVGPSEAERAPPREVLRVLFDAGGSVIDTAPMYAPAEAVVGDLLSDMRMRDKAFIATKVLSHGRAAGVAQMQSSFAKLRTDHVELMQVHNLTDWRTQLATLRDWKRQGRISYLGVTHYTASAHGELESVMRSEPLDFVQLNYAINDRSAEKTLLPLAADRGIAIIVNQPFGGGDLFRTLRGRPIPEWAGEIGCQTWAQVLLKYVLGHPAVTCVVPGTGRPEHMHDNVRAGFGVMPDRELRQRMAAALGA